MFCFLLSTAFSFAHGVVKTERQNKEGIPVIIVKEKSSCTGPDRSSSIEATINGHTLIVVFLDDLGQVAVEVSEVGGGETHATSIHTPNGVNFNIPDTGSYIVTFTLPDGDVYYGEFEVTD